MEAYLDWQSKSGGIKLNDVIEEYRYVAAGQKVKNGDLLTYVEGLSGAMVEITKAGNIFPSTWTQEVAYTKYSANGYVLESSSAYSSSNAAADACRGTANGSPWKSKGSTKEEWLKMVCPNPTKITKMKARITAFGNTSSFSKAIIQGSKDDTNWTDLHTVSAYQTSITEMDLNNTDYYTCYRILIYISTANANVGAQVDDWSVAERAEKVAETEQQVTPAIEPPFNAVALSSGVGGPDTEHNEQVKIARVPNKLSSLTVGTLVKDVNSTFLGKPVIWKIADKNHEGYPDGSVTLITERSIALRAFDAKEPNNSDVDRQTYGNNRYSVSNIRQWLNSDAGAGQWYSAQHIADQTPSSDYVSVSPYSDKVGFLNAFSQQFKNALLETNLTVALNTVTDGGGSETATDKVFLASKTEVGLGNENNIVEGVSLPIFSDDTSRLAYCTAEAMEERGASIDETKAYGWWLRTPDTSETRSTRCVSATRGANTNNYNFYGNCGARPLCNIPSSIIVSEQPDKDGCYILFAGGEA